jgi:2-iminoacetate synthase ThiH
MAGIAAPAEAIALIQSRIDTCRETYKLTPTQITLDLSGSDPEADGAGGDIGSILETVFAIKHTFGDFELAVAGLRALWRVAQGADVEVDELLAKLAESGIDSVESSGSESETDLTLGEVTDIHRQVHRAGLNTIAKAELAAPTDGNGAPLWDSFVRRVMALDEQAPAMGGGVSGVSVEVSPGSLVTGVEYMRAVALARLAAPHVPLIISALARIPTISPAQGLGTASYQHPAEKIAALCLHYGASDLGPIDVDRLNPVAVMRQIRSAGFTPVLREGQQAPLNRHHVGEMLSTVIGETRHVPPSTLKLI